MKRGEPRWRQTRLRPEQGGCFAAPVGQRCPPTLNDFFAEFARTRPDLAERFELRIIDDAFFADLRACGVAIEEGTIGHWRRLRDVGEEWVREDCGAGHRSDIITFTCLRCGARLR